ncbi:hypothetical protein M422DRAFT_39084 [Sphaerobolus stellatus SS14]|uniref:Uncharacterized protein n=1 Tax=Sphaerobolus stellatus (strain SS14) TaxID=990650 RepID=A0A0C9U674_SPHS4|nr:hypothetical protein M422DRAFT_39084 [Sphaerobolus stellatus SS14]
MAREKSWVWEYMLQGKEKAGNNKTHFKAWCRFCIAQEVKKLESEDDQCVREGLIEKMRGNETLEHEGLEPVRKVRFFFGKKRLFTISELFNWDKKSGWDEFWRRGEKRVGEELQFYELLTRANLEDRSEAINASEN